MTKLITFILLAFFVASCALSQQISNKYVGKGAEALFSDFGEPNEVIKTDEENRIFIYLKETYVKETTIGTGRGTLDERISPAFIKVETFKFILDKEGIIIETSYEKKIE